MTIFLLLDFFQLSAFLPSFVLDLPFPFLIPFFLLLPPSTLVLALSYALPLSTNMSHSRSQSRRGNFTTTIRRKEKPQALTTSKHISSTLGERRFKDRLIVRPSSDNLTPSTSTSPAPSSISHYSQDHHASTIQWDLPTAHPSETHPSSTTSQKRRTRVGLLLHLSPFLFFISFIPFIRRNQWNPGCPLYPPSWMR